jgi:hypothetical protein
MDHNFLRHCALDYRQFCLRSALNMEADKIELAIVRNNANPEIVGRFSPEEAERYMKENLNEEFAWRWVCEECEIERDEENGE